MSLLLTSGAGRQNPQGRRHEIPCDTEQRPAAFAEWLEQRPKGEDESWWSHSVFENDYRRTTNWCGADVIGCDVDYHGPLAKDDKGKQRETHVAMSADFRAQIEAALDADPIGNVVHLTPRGLRVIFVLAERATKQHEWRNAANGAVRVLADWITYNGLAAMLHEGLRCHGLAVDAGASTDLARFLYAPRATVQGQPRDATIRVVKAGPVSLDELASLAPQDPPPATQHSDRPRATTASTDLDEAVRRYNDANRREWPRTGGTCPACGHHDCFGTLPDATDRWYCHSSNHDTTCGIKGSRGYHGDALDLDAHAAGCSRVDLLRRSGYLEQRSQAMATIVVPVHRTSRSSSTPAVVVTVTVSVANQVPLATIATYPPLISSRFDALSVPPVV
jgi:hypothetical protein